jgi:O-antigen/teichoic acid export membrane protein
MERSAFSSSTEPAARSPETDDIVLEARAAAAGEPSGIPRLLRIFLSLMGAEVITRGLLLAAALIVIRILSPGDFGDYVYAISAATVAGSLVDLGLTAMITRDAAAKPDEAGSLMTTFLYAQLVLGSLTVLVASGLAVAGVIGGPASHLALVIAFVAVGINALSRPYEATLTGRGKAHFVTISRAWRGAVLVAGTALVAVLDSTPEIFLLAVVASELTGTLVVARLCVSKSTRHAPGVRARQILRLLKLAIPFTLVLGLNLLYLRVDILMIGHYESATAVGNYGAATRILETAVVVPAFFGSAFLATISHTGPTAPDARAQTAVAIRMIVLLVAPIAIAIALCAGPIVDLLAGSKYGTAAGVLWRISPMILLIASYTVLMSLQVSLDQLRTLALINVLGLVVKAGVNVWAIPRFGIDGAAVTAVIAEGLVVLLQWWYARTHVDVGPTLAHFGRIAIAGAAMFGVMLGLRHAVPWPVALLAGAAVYVAAAFLTRALSMDQLRGAFGALRPQPSP